jgi:hypothetical protein
MSGFESLSFALVNLSSPPVLAFALGIIAVSFKSDLRLPDSVYQALTIYLLLAIGIKGGVSLSEVGFAVVAIPLAGTLFIGITLPVLAFYILKFFTKLDPINRGALAAHYGSTSLVTFTAALVFLDAIEISYEGFMTTLLAAMEIPGIIVGLFLATRKTGSKFSLKQSMGELLTSKSIVLLIGGLTLGVITGTRGYEGIEPLFAGLFPGILTLFLLELGIVAGRRLKDIKQAGWGIVFFAISFPVVAGFIGVMIGQITNLSIGGATILGVIAASASYIAAPAAVRLALPQASPGIYLTAALGITFPFNLVFGIPLLFNISNFLSNWLI